MESDDLVVWPDGFMCYGEEFEGMTHRSDDFRVVAFGTDEWHVLLEAEDSEYDDEESDWDDDCLPCGCCACCGCYCSEPTDRFGNPKEGWTQCPDCYEMIEEDDLEDCPNCKYEKEHGEDEYED